MAQASDYTIDNSTGANVRADINTVLQAILTNNSGSSSPSTTAAYMWWADTTNGVLKIRNSANNAWVELLQLDGTLTLEDGSASTPGLAFRDDLNTGIYSSAPDKFNVATGGIERMELGTATIFNEDGENCDFRVESISQTHMFYVDAGNDKVGIGTSSPATALDLSGDLTITDKIIHSGDTNTAIRFPAAATVSVETGAAQRFKIDSSGHVLFNCDSLPSTSVAGAGFEKNGDQAILFSSSGSSTSSSNHAEFKNGNGTVGTINTNGSATSYNTSSDYRLKENATAISDGLTRLKTLKPYRFNFKADASTTVDGFFAHEVTAVPEAITGIKDEVDSDNNPVYQGIDQSKLVPLLVAAIQELITKVETLEAA